MNLIVLLLEVINLILILVLIWDLNGEDWNSLCSGKVPIIVIFICRIGLYLKGFKRMVVIMGKHMKIC